MIIMIKRIDRVQRKQYLRTTKLKIDSVFYKKIINKNM